MESVRYAVRTTENLSRYLRAIQEFPLLSADAEREFFVQWQQHRDINAVHQLVGSHLRLVVKLARGYRGYGLPTEDLVGEGNIGVLRAICGFDPAHGVRFSSYAIWWIRSAIQEYILHNWSLVRVATTGAQKKLFFNLRKIQAQLRQYGDAALQQEQAHEIATLLKVPVHEVITMNQRLAGRDYSLNAPVGEEGDGDWQSWLADDSDDPEAVLADLQETARRKSILPAVLQKLTDRERAIIVERRLQEVPATLDELSQRYGICRERVRQIELRAMTKLQHSARAYAA